MRRALTVLLSAAALALLAPALAQAATRTAKIPVPADGHVTVAHLVVQVAQPKPKKRPKGKKAPKPKPPAAPRLKALNKPGVIAALSMKRDAKNKNRFRVTVVVANPLGAGAGASGAGYGYREPSSLEQDGTLDLGDSPSVSFLGMQLAETVDLDNAVAAAWIVPFCDPDGSVGYVMLVGVFAPGPRQLLEDGCDLAADSDVDIGHMTLIGVFFYAVRITAFPGRNDEVVVHVEQNGVALGIAVNAVRLDFNLVLVALLAPPGAFCRSHPTPAEEDVLECLFDRGAPGSFDLNARFAGAVTGINGTITGSTDFGRTWKPLYDMQGSYPENYD